MNTDTVRIFDTTLRDGEQSPGASMSSAEKLEVARALARLGVDVMEAGFPAASPDDLEAVRRIAIEVGNPPMIEGLREVGLRSTPSFPIGSFPPDSFLGVDGVAQSSEPGWEVLPPVICGLARATVGDIDKAWEAVRFASRPRIHTFLATSEIHMQHKLRMSREQVLSTVAERVAYARSLCPDIEFSPEDAARSDPGFLYQVLAVAIQAGATTLNIPDTVGYTTPDEFGALIEGILRNTPGIENCIVSVHCHDDLGLATANTLAGIQAGARQAEVTINGIGERAGNTSLEEVVMALHTRRPFYNLHTRIDTTQITRASRLVSNYTGMLVQPNKAVVGANAFAHEAGIHQDGMLKNQRTYEIMSPEDVGAVQTRLVLGKHSGRHALKIRLHDLGYDLGEPDLNQAFERFKNLADKKKVITDADLEALVADEFYQPREIFHLDGLQVACGTMGMPTATVRLVGPDGVTHTQAAVGSGPVDAAYKAIDAIVQAPNTLLEFAVHAITEGIDALGEVTVRIQGSNGDHSLNAQKEVEQQRTYGGHGADTDIVVASVKAYLAAINKLLVTSQEYGLAEQPAVQALAA